MIGNVRYDKVVVILFIILIIISLLSWASAYNGYVTCVITEETLFDASFSTLWALE